MVGGGPPRAPVVPPVAWPAMTEAGAPGRNGTPGAPTALRSGRAGRRSPVLVLVLAVALIGLAACGSGAEDLATEPSGSDRAPGSTPSGGTASVLAEPAPPGSTAEVAEEPSTTASTSAPGGGAPPATTSAPAPLPIGTVELALVDPTRPTVSRGTTIASSRSLPTTVTYPTGSGGPWPLLVFAHGFRLGPPGYARLVASLVAAGYVVAAPSFPLADEARAGSQVDRGDLPNQPGDLSFVLDQVIAAGQDPSSPLAGRIDGSRIGAVGHSDGADTVLDLGYTAGRSDGRALAIVALSPDAVVAAGTGVGSSTPLLVEHGDADDVVPYSESISVFRAVPARRYLLTLLGAGHLDPVAQATSWTPVLDATVIAFLDRYVAGRTGDDGSITAPATSSAVARIESAG